MRDMVEVVTWAQLTTFVAVCATLALLYLRLRPAKTGEVRLRDVPWPKAWAGRA